MKNVLITGVSRGIGKALAQKFLAEGYFVIGTSTSGTVDFNNTNLVTYKLDLSSSKSIVECATEITKFGKKIDICMNNAGALFDDDETTIVIEKLRKTLEVNLIGTIDFAEQILPLVNNGGHIVFTSSSAGSISHTGHDGAHFEGYYPAYKISKAALNMYMRTLALRLKGKMTVSSVHPGWVKTDMGGEDADISAEEAAGYIFDLAISKIESGNFWFKGKKFDW